MVEYLMRRASLADVDHLLHQRREMFGDMGIRADAADLVKATREWLEQMVPANTYLGWLTTCGPDVVAGAGVIVWPWPPGPRDASGRLAVVFNVYTAPAHRRRGLAKALMAAIERYCRAEGIGQLALQASRDGAPLYLSLGYSLAEQPLMFLPLAEAQGA